MTVLQRTRVRVFALLAVVAALLFATFTRPLHDVSDVAGSDSVYGDPGQLRTHEERSRSSGASAGNAASVSLAGHRLPDAGAPLDPEEHARRREERLAARAAQRAAWEEQKREARASARARALENAKDNPEQVEYLKAQFARRDESDRLHEERREERQKRREERAANPGFAVPRPSDAPVLGAPVIGADGVAYDPHARTKQQ